MIEYADRGRARFYTPEDLNESRAGRVTDLLRDVPRLELVRDGRQIFIFVRGTRQRVPVFLDGHHMRLRRDESVDEMIALSDVEALEIYWRWAPAQYGGGAAIVMWTGPRKE
jgi:outer membrane cobalamin receptor